MKRLHNYILLSVLAFVLASCSEDEVIDNNGQNHVAGDILFGLSLPEASSRTVYGDEDKDKNVFPIYWVNGDKVQIFSPQGLEGRRNAEYVVSTIDKDGNVVTNQNYASNLTKTGAYGVQWGNGREGENGEVGLHDFYSLYPSGNYTLSTDGKKAENITINSMQNIVVNDGVVKSDMEDCLMYAKTTGVEKGKVVNLQYNPITTVLMVTVKVGENQTGTDPDNFTIQSIKLEADTEIAGTFSLNISDGSFGGFVDGKSSKTIQADIVSPSTGGYHVIKNGESFEIPLFLAPTFTVNEDGTVKEGPNVKNWKISIDANNNTYTKTLNIEKALTPGQIHKITLPELKPATTEWVVSKWMTYIPRNVYLSEVSIPGSWNSLNVDCQTVTDLNTQYNNGVRAFHLDARYNGTRSGSWYNYSYQITDLGVATGGSDNTYDVDTNVTDVASEGKVMNSTVTFETYLGTIVQCVQPDEYMVVFVTFAQNSATKKSMSWEDAVVTACKNINNNTKIDGEIVLASEINSNSVVGDVLGKVIVIINTESESIDNPDPCFYTHVPLELTDKTCSGTYELNNVEKTSGITLKASQCQVEFENTNLVNNNDGDRGFLPKPAERKEQLNSIINWSKENYNKDNYEHNAWIYLGIGGYQGAYNALGDLKTSSGSYEDVAADYNGWINGKVTEMGTIPNGQEKPIPYYPVGIVLMNNANKYASTVKNILLLNNKYRLRFDPNKGANYTPTQTTQVVSKANYDSTVNDGGNVISWN